MGEKVLRVLDFRRILKNSFESRCEVDTPFIICQSELAHNKRPFVSIVAQIDNSGSNADKRPGLVHENVRPLWHELYLEPSIRVPRCRVYEALDRLADGWA